jgi:hypothetical protein
VLDYILDILYLCNSSTETQQGYLTWNEIEDCCDHQNRQLNLQQGSEDKKLFYCLEQWASSISYLHTGCSTHRNCTQKIATSIFYRLYIQPPTEQHSMYCICNNLIHFTTCFNQNNLLTICNNHLYKHFRFINFLDFVTLAYVSEDSLKIMYIHRNMSDYLTK